CRGNHERMRGNARRPLPTWTRLGRTTSRSKTCGSGPQISAAPIRRNGEDTIMSTSTIATAAGFFAQLMPLLADRTLMVIVSKADDQHLTLSVVPKRMKDSENAALTTPLCCTGTPEELDR